jgi:hypothetical protein
VFGRNKETSADYVVVARGRAGAKDDDKAGLVATYGPMARVQARAAADAAAQAAKAYGPVARGRATEAYGGARERVSPLYAAARERARPYVGQAVGVAGPRVQRAVDQLGPRVDVARDTMVESWLPKVSAAIASAVAASAAAKDQVVEVSGRAPDAVAVLKGEAVVKQKRSGGKVWMGLGVVAAVGAAVAVLAGRKPKEDPWATPSSTYTPPKTFTDRVSGAKGTVSAAAGTAAHKVADVTHTATARAGQVTGRARGASDTPATEVTPVVPEMRTTAADMQAGTVDVLGEVADTADATAGETAIDTAGAAHDVKVDVPEGAPKPRKRAAQSDGSPSQQPDA